MIVRSEIDPKDSHRIWFDIDQDNEVRIRHFVVKITTKDNPFIPHKHAQEELWYIIEGEGLYAEDSVDYPVQSGDLIQIKPWVLHGLRTDTTIRWICLG